MPKTTRSKGTSGPQTSPEGCSHSTLRLERIAIAERCPRCRYWLRRDGRAVATVGEATAPE